MSSSPRYGHPENDLHGGGLDDANRRLPEPQSFDDLADAPDPAVVHAQNQASTRQAVWWAAGTAVVSAAVSFLLAALFRSQGGPLCEAGTATWLCSRPAEIWWSVGSSITPVLGIFGCALFMLQKLRRYLRWGPWMGAFWFLIPHGLCWFVVTIPMGILGHIN